MLPASAAWPQGVELQLCYVSFMKMRTRKLIGTVTAVLFMAVYALLIMVVGAGLVMGRGILFELPFYVIGGFAWVPVMMALIRWMAKPDQPNPHSVSEIH